MSKAVKVKEKTMEMKTPFTEAIFKPNPERTVEWLGGVSYENLERALANIKALLAEDSSQEVHLMVNSFGGGTGIGMSFYDAVRSVLKPRLTTIGSGDVDSSGVIVFLAGERRYLTKNTTMLLHLGGRTFCESKRFSTADMEQMLREDKLKDYQYACLVSDATDGRCSAEKVLELMANDTILTAEEAVNLGIAHKVLP